MQNPDRYSVASDPFPSADETLLAGRVSSPVPTVARSVRQVWMDIDGSTACSIELSREEDRDLYTPYYTVRH